jgi:hypothetical protein
MSLEAWWRPGPRGQSCYPFTITVDVAATGARAGGFSRAALDRGFSTSLLYQRESLGVKIGVVR